MMHCSRVLGRATCCRRLWMLSQCAHVANPRPRTLRYTQYLSAYRHPPAARPFSSTPAVTASKRKDGGNDALVQYTTQKGRIWLPECEKWIRPWTPSEIKRFASGWTRGLPLHLVFQDMGKKAVDLDEVAFYKKLIIQLCRQRDPSLPSDLDKYDWSPAYHDVQGPGQAEERRRLLNNKIKRRLRSIYDALLDCYPHPEWVTALQKKKPNEWIDQIVELISDPVREILASPYPPTIAKLKELPWLKVDEQNASVELGVYGLLDCAPQNRSYTSNEVDLYVGSAASRWGGLLMRLVTHYFAEHKKIVKSPGFVQDATLNLTRPRFPIILLRLPNPMASKTPDKIQEDMHLIVLAEALFMVYLGAMSTAQGERHPLARSSPWDVEDIPYGGISGANPLWEAYGATKLEEKGHEHDRRLFARPQEWPGWPTKKPKNIKSQKESDDEAIAAILAAAGIKAFPGKLGSRSSSQKEVPVASSGDP
ncbi:hypothetical protein QBC32DRAFT_224790 [Pseudoneurospora amorphoporcata]|uniref:Uncharacterized protein n=1 Tax=Pseudoneurospora amorphoporcata TaxID=241081 RepID=A0AAN6NJU6_9PEZI|nr:hypothetical protein QBC32DRAFT_224790 [Pseudoneurospora amorphoporcata]